MCLVLAFCLVPGARSAGAAIPKTVTARNFFGTMTFDRPLALVDFPGRDSTYLIVQQSGGMIRVDRRDGVWTKSRFDSAHVTGINGIVNPRGPGEGTPSGTDNDGGLLGFAFHPDYDSNGRYFISYVSPSYPGGTVYPGTIILEERRADSTRLTGGRIGYEAGGDSSRILLALPKPYIYHNGGTLRFGADGYLYAAIGDGGGSGDPQNRAQNKGVLFGKFIRIDVDKPDAFAADTLRNYAVPPDNPFVDSTGFLPEIWAYGVRSPWKWSFHPYTGEIWMGDIGQSRYEEVSRVPRGGNLGWRQREGDFCFNPSSNCASAGLTPPVMTFPSRTYGQSVTGGVFFTGDTGAAFHRVYIFGDFIRGNIWGLREHMGTLADTALLLNVANVASIDKDARGNVFALSLRNGDWSRTGVAYILESPDMRQAPEPVNLLDAGAVRGRMTRMRPSISWNDVRREPGRYVVTGLDGRVFAGIPAGTRTGLYVVKDRVRGTRTLMTVAE